MAALTVGAVGCGGPSASTPREILVHAAETAETVNSVHFSLQQPNTSLELSSGVRISDAEGDVLGTDRARMNFTILLGGGLSADEQLIAVGGERFVTNPRTGGWQASPSAAAAPRFLDRERGVPNFLRSIVDPQRLSNEVLDAVQTLHLQGRVRTSTVEDMIETQASTDIVNVEVWVGAEDTLVRQLMLLGRLDAGDTDSTIRTIKFSDFGQPVTIERPRT